MLRRQDNKCGLEKLTYLVPGIRKRQDDSAGAEHFIAERMKAKKISLPSSHVSLVSHPGEIADFILTAANEVTQASVN